MSRARDTANQINRVNSSAADATAITVDSLENVGIGVVPESSYPARPMLRIGSGLGLMCRASGNPSHTWINSNVYQDPSSADDKYIATDEASQIRQTNGSIHFMTAESGSANATISWTNAMSVMKTGGITFNGDTAAANALNDYEEGTWTPAVSSGGLTISSGFTARYTKIGRLVTVICDCNLSGTGNGDDMKISGLPFTSLSLGHASGAGYTETYPSAQNGSNAAFVPKSGNNDTFVYFQNGNGTRYDGDKFSAGFLNFTITYFTS